VVYQINDTLIKVAGLDDNLDTSEAPGAEGDGAGGSLM